ncbi:MAG: efflux RND transporter periplasmic adaptor subunit [candidate division KSB1 bacterium]|nr:efflux RND transporter periplasmic adaptor subunit [candidate division KSB1 bacterium]
MRARLGGSRKGLWLGLSAAGVICLVIAIRVFRSEEPIPEGASEAREEVSTAPVPVRVKYAFTGDLVLRITATGRTRARQSVSIHPHSNGFLTEVRVRDGQQVQRGEVLFRLDDRQAQLQVREARDDVLRAEVEFGLLRAEAREAGDSAIVASRYAGVGLSEEEFRHIEDQYRAGKITESAYERARIERDIARIFSGSSRDEMMAVKSGLAAAFARLKHAELELDYTIIRAPFSGTVGHVRVSPGQWVSPSQELCKLVDLSTLEFDAEVLESEIGQVRIGAGVEVRFSAYPDTAFKGRVTGINPVLNEESRTYTVLVELPNPRGKLLDGMYGEAKLEAQVLRNRLLVPRSAVIERDRRKLVFVVRKNAVGQDVAQWCYITPGQENEEYVEVLDSAFGLKPGEPVVVEGHFTLSHDAPVQPIE